MQQELSPCMVAKFNIRNRNYFLLNINPGSWFKLETMILLFQVDLITTLTKLSCLGQQINYEAYTYPVKKIELSKLKL